MSEKVEAETVTATLGASIRNAYDDVEVRKEQGRQISFQVRSTNAQTKTYRRLGSGQTAEAAPAGLAAALYAQWSVLGYSGGLQWLQANCAIVAAPGWLLNLTGGNSAWATMAAIVQRIEELYDEGITVVQFGPARHLGADDMRQVLQAFRRRAPAYSYQARTTGKTEDKGQTVAQGKDAAKHDVAEAPGEVAKMLLRDYAVGGAPTSEIHLDPAEVDTVGQVLTVVEESSVKKLKVDWARFT